MKKLIVAILVFSFLFQVAFASRAEASGKLITGVILTGAGIVAIIVGNEDVNVLKQEYDFATYVYYAIWDDVFNVYISEWWDYQLEPHPETVVQKDIITSGWAYGTNNYDIYLYTRHNHHKVYETEKQMTVLGKMGLVSTGIGITLIIDYLLDTAKIKKKAGIEVKTVTRPDYSGVQLVKKF